MNNIFLKSLFNYGSIVKAHGGEIKVERKNGEGSKLIIQLTIKINP